MSRITAKIQPHTFRKQRNWWLACLSEYGRPLLRHYARSHCPTPPTAPSAWKLGLLLGANHIGDVLYRTASLPALKRGLPGCAWYFVTASPADEVLRHNPHLAGLITLPAGKLDVSSFRAKLIAQLGALPDVAVCYDSGSYLPSLSLATKLGIPNRVAYVHKGFSGLVTHPIGFRGPQSFPAYFRDMVAELTGQKPDWSLAPQVYPDQKDELAAEKWKLANGLKPGELFIACFCTSRQPSGVLPLEKFIEIFRLIHQQTPVRMILCGAKPDRATLERVNTDAQLHAPILAGELGLRSLYCLLRDCHVVVSTDSGPRHLANAAGTPVVFVRNLTASKVETGAYADTDHDLAPDVQFIPPLQQAEWMAKISPTSLADQVLLLLKASRSKQF